MNIERIKFDDKNALGVYLLNLIEKLNQDDEYNIFLHQINECGYKGFNINNVLEVKINSIFANRLRISHYSSLSGTTKLMGTSKNFNVDKLFDKYSCFTPASAIVRAYKDEDELRYQESLFDL